MGAVAALTAGAVSFGMAIAPAGATLATGLTVQVCNELPTPLCMSGFDGNGGAVKGEPHSPGSAQDVEVLQNTDCGGFVTSDCPFTPGLGLNNEYVGDPIVTITNEANGMTYRSNSLGTAVVEVSGGGNGQLWVEHDLGTATELVNVYGSDQQGTTAPACTQGSGFQVALSSPFEGANCEWRSLT